MGRLVQKTLEDVSFRTSPSFESKVGALSAWLRQGELEASLMPCNPWNADQLNNILPDLRALAKAKSLTYFLPRLRELCASVDVALVVVRPPTGSRASGATRFVSPEKAMIIVSFRYRSDDHFWFTFFPEIGRVLLHGPTRTFIDSDDTSMNEKETEANAFAANVLIPPHRYEKLMSLRGRKAYVVRYAVSLGLSPGIVVGQMQHHGVIGPSQLNYLKSWDEIIQAIS